MTMAKNTPEIHPTKVADTPPDAPQKGARKVPDTLDGRTKAAKRHRELVVAFRKDFGRDDLTTAEGELIDMAATATVRAQLLKAKALKGEDVDDNEMVRLLNSAARLLIALGVQNRKRNKPTKSWLQQYLEAKNGKANAQN